MNYMNEVAKMLGVELGEEFELIKYDSIFKYKLTADGLVAFSPITKDWHEGNKLLVDLLLGNNEIVKIPILDEVEKRYLSNIIKPWRNCVKCIFKYGSEGYEYVVIKYDNKLVGRTDQYILLPAFEKGKMYKGMKFGNEYTLDELGL